VLEVVRPPDHHAEAAMDTASKFEALESIRLSDGVFRQVFQLIANGTLAAGERLPAERELARSLGVSRSSVREGLRVLDQLGLVDVRRGAGVFVVKDTWKASSGLLWLPWLIEHQEQVIELVRAREVIEPGIASLAALSLTHRDKDDLTLIQDDLARALATEDFERAVALDGAFHTRIAEITKNKVLETLVRSMHAIIHRNIGGPYHFKHHIGDKALHEHSKILSAIIDRSPLRAATAMRTHLCNVRATLDDAVRNAKSTNRSFPVDGRKRLGERSQR
jgi:DNA-binding FadR family transcriptional regulator